MEGDQEVAWGAMALQKLRNPSHGFIKNYIYIYLWAPPPQIVAPQIFFFLYSSPIMQTLTFMDSKNSIPRISGFHTFVALAGICKEEENVIA